MSDYLKKAEQAIHYIGESEAEYARLKGLIKLIPERMKIMKASLILECDEKSATAKQTWAEGHKDFEMTIDSCETVYADFYLIEAKRARAELTIEMYRSINSALKRGNI
jgi:hypothetical protein